MEPTVLQQELVELLILLQNLNTLQLKQLCDFVEGHAQDGWFPQLSVFLQKATPKQVEDLLALSANALEPDKATTTERELQPIAKDSGISVKDLQGSFNTIIQLFHLQGLLQGLSILQLMKLFEVMPSGPQVQQRQLLQQVQQLLAQLQPEALANLHRQMEQATPGSEQQTLSQLLNLPFDHFQLYQPLRLLLQLDLDELLKLQEELPKLTPIQNRQLLQLLQMQPFDVLELRNAMNPWDGYSNSDLLADTMQTNVTSPTSLDITPVPPPPNSEKKLGIQIVEQPPEKSVYKRNLKPNPMVVVTGDQKVSGNLMVAAVLVRCDTFQEESKFLTGNRPERATPGKAVSFRKLKITTTSHQQQETLFCIKFELRRYTSEEEFEILDAIHSNPVCVLSHSTQMKPVPTAAPVISEVIPPMGPPNGGTRVAVLGSNFVDSPAARIRFDTTDVMPIFHGPGTLICHTPQHTPGTVSVRVCNSAKKWSETSATFTYDSSLETFRDYLSETLVARQHFDPSLSEASWSGNFDAVKRLQDNGTNINAIDTRGYAPMHYACSNGNIEFINFLIEKGADVNVQDKKGATPLFWASVFGFEEIVQMLVDQGSNPNLPDFMGLTPLGASILQGYERIAFILLENGASPNIPAMSGETSLHLAAAVGNRNLLSALVHYGGFINCIDEEGDTPLHYAIRESQLDAVQALLQAGAFKDMPNCDLETPLHFAVLLHEYQLASVLVQNGASMESTGSVEISSIFQTQGRTVDKQDQQRYVEQESRLYRPTGSWMIQDKEGNYAQRGGPCIQPAVGLLDPKFPYYSNIQLAM